MFKRRARPSDPTQQNIQSPRTGCLLKFLSFKIVLVLWAIIGIIVYVVTAPWIARGWSTWRLFGRSTRCTWSWWRFAFWKYYVFNRRKGKHVDNNGSWSKTGIRYPERGKQAERLQKNKVGDCTVIVQRWVGVSRWVPLLSNLKLGRILLPWLLRLLQPANKCNACWRRHSASLLGLIRDKQ